jgi:hypothetical protein
VSPVQGPGGPDARRLHTWDTRVVFIERQGRWWWNARRDRTTTKLYGFADSPQAAHDAMYRAIARAPPAPESL